MYHTLYITLVLTANPTIPTDLKALGNEQFKVREAATRRLESLPPWTAMYFKYYARKTIDPEVRIRCQRVYETQNGEITRKMQIIHHQWMQQKDWIEMRNDLERRIAFERNEYENRMQNLKQKSNSSGNKK